MAALPVVLLTSMSVLLGMGGEGVEPIQSEAVPEEPAPVALCSNTYRYFYYSTPARTHLVGFEMCECGRPPIGWGAETPYVLAEHGVTCGGGSTELAPEGE